MTIFSDIFDFLGQKKNIFRQGDQVIGYPLLTRVVTYSSFNFIPCMKVEISVVCVLYTCVYCVRHLQYTLNLATNLANRCWDYFFSLGLDQRVYVPWTRFRGACKRSNWGPDAKGKQIQNKLMNELHTSSVSENFSQVILQLYLSNATVAIR